MIIIAERETMTMTGKSRCKAPLLDVELGNV
jgi:hypothetical protein